MDASLSLAITLNKTKGATALLLGSGISSAAGILTGWGVTLNLVQQVAALQKADPDPDPATWYKNKYGEEPDYAKLLELLAPTATERQRLLRDYFIPTEEDRDQNRKTPTKAHRAIAELVSKGYIRVILTTNFDPLLEQALEEVGVHPSIVSDVSGIKGMMPMQHEQITIIKLHGHYLDTRLRNTPAELAKYEPELNQLLDRVFDEYGLLIAGWSGVWDTALRDALLRCPTRRFSTYWTTMGSLAEAAKPLARQRAAQIIPIESADSFFQDLAEKVLALEDLAQPHPVSTPVAVAIMKRYLLVDTQRIRLQELVTDEVERVWTLAGTLIPTVSPASEVMKQTILAIDQLCERTLYFLGLGSYWAGQMHQTLWLRAVIRLSKLKVNKESSSAVWSAYHDYPMLLCFYAVGLGATAAGDYDLLLNLLIDTKLHYRENYPQQKPAERLDNVIQQEYMQPVEEQASKLYLNEHLQRVLRPVFTGVIPDDTLYREAFDELEYLMTLVFFAESPTQNTMFGREFYRGLYMTRRRGWSRPNIHIEAIRDKLKAAGAKGLLLQRGLFNNSVSEQETAITKLDELMNLINSRL
ncbi:SIR2 family protein [Hymenobacter sp. YC55]|uniref:SIR2 family protein n=1 Tax=Hymenobacter sp. YC55 TaxID=3034019 RepID=UPI0023F9B7B2|nr:SIR2 family protein [Hymenobacter sp. YC55]MDF7815167.1 SIR2 family protein [Hymenobacter sp. YC55]